MPFVLAVTLVTATASQPPATTASAVPLSAMNGYVVSRLSPVEMDLELAAMQARGVEVVRSDAPWANIEPHRPDGHRHSWRFDAIDGWVRALALHQLTWEPILDYAVGWAKRCAGFCPPTSNATYDAYATAVAARYGAGGAFWSEHPGIPYHPVQIFEIWNEENVATYFMTPARYASLYDAARRAIHRVDPGATVIVGGLADDSQQFDAADDYPARYVQGMFKADPRLRGNVDGFGLHPYGATADDVERWVVDFRRQLDRLGEATAPIDITEVGWPTGGWAQENWRASMMSEVASALVRSNCGIGLLAPYDWTNQPQAGSAGDFGLVNSTGVVPLLRPAGQAWFKALHAAVSQPQLDLCS